MFRYKHKIIVGLISVLFVMNCGEKVPVKEMASAKLEISRAMSVRAKQYAPQEIEEAEKKLMESHEFIKQDALDKGKKSAVESRGKAVEAFNKSIPLLAKDTLEIAKQSFDQADAAYAAVLAENEYKQAEESYKKANELYENKEYYPCYEKALEADGLSKDARNVAVGKKEILSKSISEVRAVLADAEKYNASQYAKDKVDAANENLRAAEESLGTLELKKGFTAMEAAGTNADEAYLTAIKETARVKIEEAEKLLADAEISEGAVNAKDELKASKEALEQSKTQFQDSKYTESISSSEESIRLSNTVLNSLNSLSKEKIAGAELIYLQAKDSPGAAAAAAQLNGAKAALDKAKSFYSESKYKEAIASAAESERLSNIVINTDKKGGIAVSSVSEDYFIYKVRYIPERRDCLWRIAGKYYSNPFLWKNIYNANTDKIRNPNLIWPNMLIKVPKLTGKSTEKLKETAVPEKTSEIKPEPEKETQVVEKSSEAVPAKEAAPEPLKETPEKAKDTVPSEPAKEAAPDKGNDNVATPSKSEEVSPAAEPEIMENTPDSEEETDIISPSDSSDESSDEVMPEESEEPLNEN